MNDNKYKEIAKWLESKCCKCTHLKWGDGGHYCDILPTCDLFEYVNCENFERFEKEK